MVLLAQSVLQRHVRRGRYNIDDVRCRPAHLPLSLSPPHHRLESLEGSIMQGVHRPGVYTVPTVVLVSCGYAKGRVPFVDRVLRAMKVHIRLGQPFPILGARGGGGGILISLQARKKHSRYPDFEYGLFVCAPDGAHIFSFTTFLAPQAGGIPNIQCSAGMTFGGPGHSHILQAFAVIVRYWPRILRGARSCYHSIRVLENMHRAVTDGVFSPGGVSQKRLYPKSSATHVITPALLPQKTKKKRCTACRQARLRNTKNYG